MKIKIIIVLVIATLIVVALLGNHKSDGSTVKIGVVYALTGPASIWSENGINAAKMAVEEINTSGGIHGKKIELIVEDSKTDPKSSVSAFNKLTSIDKVDVIVGDVWSFITNPLIPLAESNKIVLISPTVMNSSVEKASPYFFTMGHTIESQVEAMKMFFASNPQIKTVYDLCWNDRWGQAHSKLLQKIAQELNISMIGQSCTADFANDYRTEAVKIKSLQPDAIFITSAFEDVAIKALYQQNVTAQILTTTGIVEAVRARSFPIEYTKNIWFMDWTPSQDFINKYYKKYNKYPIMEAQNHYETIYSIAKALENSPTDILAGLVAVKYKSTDGEIDFTQGDHITVNKAKAGLYRINLDGSFKEVK
jgi:branched-chain amino acid transport system substrate-binding protein